MSDALPRIAVSFAVSAAVSIATAIVIVTLAILPFLTPAWVGFEQGRAQAMAWTGYSQPELRHATDAILSDLVVGPPAFDVTVRNQPVLDERERAHMRDVWGVFGGLWLLAAVSGVVLVAAALVRRPLHALGVDIAPAVRRGAAVLAVGVVAAGLVAAFAFDTLFTLFHDVFFPPGTWTFDPATERLVQLFPYQFWLETSLAAGALIVVVSAIVALAAAARARSRQVRPASATAHAERSVP